MRLIIFTLLIACELFAQNVNKYSKYSLFTDDKARKAGDIITVLIMESSTALNNSKTSASRNSKIDLNFSGGVGNYTVPSVTGETGTGSDFGGKGSTETRGIVRARISAIVDTVYSNGNLRIKGEKKISINGEEQYIKISGIVRPSDIKGNNVIESYNITDAKITIEGSGMIDRVQSPGWLTKLFHWLF